MIYLFELSDDDRRLRYRVLKRIIDRDLDCDLYYGCWQANPWGLRMQKPNAATVDRYLLSSDLT